MRLQLVTPDRQLLDTEIDEVYAPGIEGQFGVLPLHVNFLTALDIGELRYRTDGRDHWVAVRGGVAEVLNDVVTILADEAEASTEIDPEDAKADEQSAAAALARADASTPEASDLTDGEREICAALCFVPLPLRPPAISAPAARRIPPCSSRRPPRRHCEAGSPPDGKPRGRER